MTIMGLAFQYEQAGKGKANVSLIALPPKGEAGSHYPPPGNGTCQVSVGSSMIPIAVNDLAVPRRGRRERCGLIPHLSPAPCLTVILSSQQPCEVGDLFPFNR